MKILKISFEKQDFPKVSMKCLEIARLQDIAPNTPDQRCPLCRRTPLWKFLPTGLWNLVFLSTAVVLGHVNQKGHGVVLRIKIKRIIFGNNEKERKEPQHVNCKTKEDKMKSPQPKTTIAIMITFNRSYNFS